MLLCDPAAKYQIEPVKKNAKFVVFTLITSDAKVSVQMSRHIVSKRKAPEA